MDDDSKKAARTLREIERRLVWLASLLVVRATRAHTGNEDCAKAADDMLAHYERRFDAIPPDGM